MTTNINCENLFTDQQLAQLLPESTADKFFDALFGDVSEGAYDISLSFSGRKEDRLLFEFCLNSRPGKCLRCSLTHGLPDVFSRHPIININGIVEKINGILDGCGEIDNWELGRTREINQDLHIIPLMLFLKKD